MTSPSLVLRDKTLGLRFSSDIYHNELGTLHSLFFGLSDLNKKVSELEEIARRSENGKVVFGFFANLENSFNLPAGSNHLLPCFYHWFGASAVNFVRLVGLLKGVETGEIPNLTPQTPSEKASIKRYCNDYVRSVDEITDVRVWRNKVFAHFSNTDPYGDDNEALLQQVAFYPVTYNGGILEVGGMQLSTGAPDDPEIDPFSPEYSSSLPSWSLTRVFALLHIRYQFSLEAG